MNGTAAGRPPGGLPLPIDLSPAYLHVNDLVAGGVEGGTSGASGHRLAGADLAGDDTERGLLDAMQDAGDGLLVRDTGKELGRCQRLREGGPGEAEVGEPQGLGGHEV